MYDVCVKKGGKVPFLYFVLTASLKEVSIIKQANHVNIHVMSTYDGWGRNNYNHNNISHMNNLIYIAPLLEKTHSKCQTKQEEKKKCVNNR